MSAEAPDDLDRLIQDVLSRLGFKANAAAVARGVKRLNLGLPAEDEFSVICAWLKRCRLVHKLDQAQSPPASSETFQVPDLLAAFDRSGPVLIEVKSKKSQTLSFHPKVIWWRGYGAYIGSANLTQAAWYNNVEAGFFLTDDELDASGQALELDALFAKIDQAASPLTKELMDLLDQRSAELQRRHTAQKAADTAFLATDLVRPWEGLVQVTSKSANNLQREAFLQEWISTLQTIRGIAAIVSRDENRPDWVSPDAPLGAQADQFLHAHYYKNTFDGRAADYERHYAANAHDPDAALAKAVKWWKGLGGGSDEERTLNEVAPMLRDAFAPTALQRMNEDDFVEVMWNIHASREYARRVPNAKVGLPGDVDHSMPVKSDALARRMWRDSLARGAPVADTLGFVLYGGAPEEVPHRLWDALHDPKRKVEMLGVSSLGEIVGWAMPERYPPRNGRTSKALRALGHDVRVHVG